MEASLTSNVDSTNLEANTPLETSQNELFVNATENDLVLQTTTAVPNAWTISAPPFSAISPSIAIAANSTYDNSSCYVSEYGNSLMPLAYTNLNGLEEVIMLKKEDIVKMLRKKKTTVALSKKFPFFSIKLVEYTEIQCINVANTKKPIIFNALECPSRIAKRLGISYEKTNSVDLVDDDLGV